MATAIHICMYIYTSTLTYIHKYEKAKQMNESALANKLLQNDTSILCNVICSQLAVLKCTRTPAQVGRSLRRWPDKPADKTSGQKYQTHYLYVKYARTHAPKLLQSNGCCYYYYYYGYCMQNRLVCCCVQLRRLAYGVW